MLMLLCAITSGCMQSTIREEETRRDLPAIDPQAGLAKEITCTIYTRVLEESYLVGMEHTIEVRAGEKTEYAIMEALLKEPSPLSTTTPTLFPAGTEIVDVSLDGTILYITLSKEFLDKTEFNQKQKNLQRDKNSGNITESTYKKNLQDLETDYEESRRLALYAAVNTLTDYSENIRVLILVDKDGSGTGTRLPRSELGLDVDSTQETELIEPLGFNADVVITPQITAEIFMQHLQNEEYASVYALLADNRDFAHGTKDYMSIQKELQSYGKLLRFSVNGMTNSDGRTSYANVDLYLQQEDGDVAALTNRRLLMRNTGGLYRPDYSSLKQVLGGQA